MVDMKDARSLLEPNPTEYKKDPKNNYLDNDLKCVSSLLDIDSYWMFQRTSTQRMMISLPSDTFYTFGETRIECYAKLKKRVPDLQHIFDYECIDIVIHGGDHFSRVFVVNALKALERGESQNDNKDHVPSILLCNSWSLTGVHTKENVSSFVITFLNYI